MLKIAITGNIASGKSEVEKILTEKGYKVLDTDFVTHQILKSDITVKSAFKDYDVFENNQISREKLGKLVFSDEKLKNKLENIIHPKIKIEIEKFFQNNSNEEYVFVAIPLLFECGMEKMFDKVICIYSDTSTRLNRLIKRNNWTEEYALKRINSQISQDLKIQKSDYIIENNSTVADLETKIYNLF